MNAVKKWATAGGWHRIVLMTMLLGTGSSANSMQGAGSIPGTCGTEDDGSSESTWGLTVGGEIGWLKELDCLQSVSSVHTAYGSLMFPGNVTNGELSQIAVYADASPDGDPGTDLTRVAHLVTVVTNGNTDILNPNPLPQAVDIACRGWILASARHVAGDAPAAADKDHFSNWWLCGDESGSTNGGQLDTEDLSNNSFPPFHLSPTHGPGVWLLRAQGFDCAGGDDPFFSLCDCAGAGPCGNDGAPGRGCRNGSEPAGALLEASGAPAPGALTLHGSGLVPGQAGLYFQGNFVLNGGSGLPFGDGLRCVGGALRRLQVVVAGPNGTSQTSVDLFAAGAVQPGDIKYYQLWYRDPQGSPCGALFNLTNALRVRW